MPVSEVYNEDCMEGMKRYPDKFFDLAICDPPYLYLKHKLDRSFDETAFFYGCSRLINDNGFIVLFGRGTSFYRWNTYLSELGFQFKEEIIWDKIECTSPVQKIGRIHETISIYSKNSKSHINSVHVEYVEQRHFNLNRILVDIKRLKTALNNTVLLDRLISFITSGDFEYYNHLKTELTYGNELGKPLSVVSVANSIKNGIKERSIISITKDRYDRIHPTQKPIRLYERLISLVCQQDTKIIDPFCGSGSSRIAAYSMGFDFTGFEIDADYFEAGNKRFENFKKQLKLF